MKKILNLLMIALVMLSFCSCEELIVANRQLNETRMLETERPKIPFIIQNYQKQGFDVKDIVIDTVTVTYQTPDSFFPVWGYFVTRWTITTTQSESVRKESYSYDYGYSYDDEFSILTNTTTVEKEYFVEITDITREGNRIIFKAKWPEDPIKEIL